MSNYPAPGTTGWSKYSRPASDFDYSDYGYADDYGQTRGADYYGDIDDDLDY